MFTSHNLNGNLRTKGAYKNDNYDGKWEVFYDDGKPKIEFEGQNGVIKVWNAWDAKGKKTVDNGKGAYKVNFGAITWTGKLENGTPNNIWRCYRSDDVEERNLVEELFRKGVFQKVMHRPSITPIHPYNDLIAPAEFPYVRTERMFISQVPCNGIKRKHIVGAQYSDGLSAFSGYILEALTPIMNNYNLKDFQDKLVLDGEVSEKGTINNLKTDNPFNESLARTVINRLRSNLPPLHPATADGVPIKQKFTITLTFTDGRYYVSYRFLPIIQ